MRPRKPGPPPPHYIRHNLASRWPSRFIVFDTETRWTDTDGVKEHTFRLAAASWWDTDTKRDSEPTYASFREVSSLWSWIDSHCKRAGRTIAYAHNLGFDVQVSRMFESLPALGWSLDWFNLERTSTLAAWRRGQQTLICCDSGTLFPGPLAQVAGLIDDAKETLPANEADDDEWAQRCLSDVRILTTAVLAFNEWARSFDVGNWRPSGSGLAWSLWRHKFLTDKVLARSGEESSVAEREGMVTGRAEAWRIGEAPAGGFFDWDMRQCYVTIASQVDVPVQHRLTVAHLTLDQYERWKVGFAVLSRVTVTQSRPIVGLHDGSGFRWPVGTFETTLWDPEIDLLLAEGATVTFGESRRYRVAPALQKWAEWTIGQLRPETADVPPVVSLWVKSQSRSLIGRFGMRHRGWEPHPDGNGFDMVGISREGGPGMKSRTLLHIGAQAWAEGVPEDTDDCVVSITGYVMAEARVRLWRAIQAAGEGNVYHVDTDGLLVNREGDRRLCAYADANPDLGWLLKSRFGAGEVRATRNYVLGEMPRIAGVPAKAKRIGDDEWEGEQWQGVRDGLRSGRINSVQVRRATWRMTAPDSRRHHNPDGTTRPYTPGEYDEIYPKGRRTIAPRPTINGMEREAGNRPTGEKLDSVLRGTAQRTERGHRGRMGAAEGVEALPQARSQPGSVAPPVDCQAVLALP